MHKSNKILRLQNNTIVAAYETSDKHSVNDYVIRLN